MMFTTGPGEAEKVEKRAQELDNEVAHACGVKEHDLVNHPTHYTSHPSGIECIEITRHMGFNLGNAMKYVWRADLKGGVEDLEKAVWYINDEIAKRSALAVDGSDHR